MAQNDIFEYPKFMDFEKAIEEGLITYLDDDFDQLFIDAVFSNAIDKDIYKKASDFKVVYTPFHGTGAYIVPKLLEQAGLLNVYLQKEQMISDGTFPYVPNPNPESPMSYQLSLELAKEKDADIVIATDPDCDRVGARVKNSCGEYVFLSGNQVGILLLE